MEYCCSIIELGGFTSRFDFETDKEANKAAERELQSRLPSNKDRICFAAVLTNDQSHMLKALKKNKFKVIGTYAGHDGNITVCMRGLKVPRK